MCTLGVMSTKEFIGKSSGFHQNILTDLRASAPDRITNYCEIFFICNVSLALSLSFFMPHKTVWTIILCQLIHVRKPSFLWLVIKKTSEIHTMAYVCYSYNYYQKSSNCGLMSLNMAQFSENFGTNLKTAQLTLVANVETCSKLTFLHFWKFFSRFKLTFLSRFLNQIVIS